MAASPERSLVVTASGRVLRRRLGLTAWAALEDLLLDASRHGPGGLGVYASARSLGVRLGVSKDTAAAALRRLVAVGLVCREVRRDVARGVFARSIYVFDTDRLKDAGIELRRAGPSTPSRPRARAAAGKQGALFESEPAARA